MSLSLIPSYFSDYDVKQMYKTLIKTDIYESPDSLSNPVGELSQDEQIVLLEPNLGKYFQLSKIVYREGGTNVEGYIRSCFLAPDDSTGNTSPPETYEIIGEEQEEPVPNPVKTKDAKLGIPYMEGKFVNIVMDSGFVDMSELESNLADLKLTAISKMVDYYGKNATNIQLNEFVANPFGLISMSDTHFPARPCKGIVVKFSVRKKYFNAFENMSFDDFSIRNIHKNFIAVSISAKDLEKSLSDLVKVLEKYNSDVSSFSGSLVGIDFSKSGGEIRNFLSNFKKFLSANNVSLANVGESKFELGFNMDTYRLEYVLHFNPYGDFMIVGLKDLSSQMTTLISKILIAHKDILSASLAGMNWMDLSKNFLAGEFKIDFTSPAAKAPSIKKPKSELEADLKRVSADYDDLTIMDSDKSGQLSNLKKDPKFKEKASELLLRSRDQVGDNFLINLPEILANVEDLNSLYGLVFDKVSIKDLVDLLMEKMTENLNLPDINEIKLRGIMKAIKPNMALELMDQFIQTPQQLSAFSIGVCDLIELSENNIDSILGSFTSSQDPIQFYLIHYKDSNPGVPAGMLADVYVGDLAAKLAENGITDCESLYKAYRNGNFNIGDYYQETALRDIICDILTNGLPEMTDICVYSPSASMPGTPTTFPSLGLSSQLMRTDIMSFLKAIDPGTLIKGIDAFIKELFADAQNYQKQLDIGANPSSYVPGNESPNFSGVKFSITPGDLFDNFAKIPKIKLELDKLSLTKKKMLNKVPNVNLDLESKKKDVNFSLPSIKSVNPSFDFTSFEFGSIGDIFGQAVESIENSLVDGIEKGLINAFKGILQNVLDSLNMDMPDIDSPDFGGLDMNDLMDASDGTSAEAVASLILDDLNFEIGKFNPDFDPSATDITGYAPSLDDIKGLLSGMSSNLKPLELTRIMKGQHNKKDYENMACTIKDDKLKQAFTPSMFNKAMATVADLADIAMLEELESAYDNKEVMVAVCKNNGIPYCLRDIKDTLEEKYSSMTPEQICDLIDDIVEETKNSLVDAIGSMKEDFQDNLPFNEDPCSFMPKPADMPAMNFVNNVAFDAIFNPIELEYKAEAASFPDLMMMSTSPDEYVKCRLFQYDSVPVEVFQDPNTGLFDIEYDFISNVMGSDFDPNFGTFNQDFSNHYFGPQTPIYYLGNDRNFQIATADDYELSKENDEYFIARTPLKSVDGNLYVKKATETLRPIPRLKDSYLNSNWVITGYGAGMLYSVATEVASEDRPLTDADIRRGYKIQFENLSSEATMGDVDFTPKDLESEDLSDGSMLLYIGGREINISDRSPRITFDLGADRETIKNTSNMLYPSVDALVNPRCVNLDSTFEVNTDTGYSYYAKSIKDSIAETTYAINRNGLNWSGEFTGADDIFTDWLGIRLDGYDTIGQISSKEDRQKSDLVAQITADTAQTMMLAMGDSPLFKTNEMLSFLFETEDVNLFRVQEAKNAAKDDFNEDCEFKDDNKSKLKESSTKQLIYLTFRIYTIDVIMKSCFINSVVYEEEMSDYLIKFVFEYMVQELQREKESYYSVFKDLYKQEYGEDLESRIPDPPDKFKEIVSEIYLEMKEYFDIIFPRAAAGTVRAAVKKMNIFTGGDAQFPAHLYDTYMYGINMPNENTRFMIQMYYRNSDGREVFLNTLTASGRRANQPIMLRLCYVVDWYQTGCNDAVKAKIAAGLDVFDTYPAGPKRTEYWYRKHLDPDNPAYDDDDTIELSHIGDNGNASANNSVRQTLGDFRNSYMGDEKNIYVPVKVSKMYNTLAYNMYFGIQGFTQFDSPYLFVLPLAETAIDTTGATYTQFSNEGYHLFKTPQTVQDFYTIDGKKYDYENYMNLTIAKYISESVDGAHAEEFTIYDFLKNRVRLDSYIDLIRRTMLIKLQQLKPEIMFAFSDTKAAIRRSIMSLSKEKEVYDYIELETDTTMQDQSQGVGTSPDFSPKAKKMALMTVPLIVKGMAEMFDPNTKIASVIRKGANLSGLDIPPTVASLMALPFNVIPLAPGPPITPLGLTYLATSFLEPKERKKLSDLKRGKNINPGADPETGGFVGGSPEELLEDRELAAREAYVLAEQVHIKVISFCKTWTMELVQLFKKIYDEDLKVFNPGDDTAYDSVECDFPNNGDEQIQAVFQGAANGSHVNVGRITDYNYGDERLAAYIFAIENAWNDLYSWTSYQLDEDRASLEYDRESHEADLIQFLTRVRTLIFHHLSDVDGNRKFSSGSSGTHTDRLLSRMAFRTAYYLGFMEDSTSAASTNGYSYSRFLATSRLAGSRQIAQGTMKLAVGLNRAIAFLGYGISKIMHDAGLYWSPIDFSDKLDMASWTDGAGTEFSGRRTTVNSHPSLAETMDNDGSAIISHDNINWQVGKYSESDDEWSSIDYYRRFVSQTETVSDSAPGVGRQVVPKMEFTKEDGTKVRIHDYWRSAASPYSREIITYTDYASYDSDGKAERRKACKKAIQRFRDGEQVFFYKTYASPTTSTGGGGYSPKGVGIDLFFKQIIDSSLFDMLVTMYMEEAEKSQDQRDAAELQGERQQREMEEGAEVGGAAGGISSMFFFEDDD